MLARPFKLLNASERAGIAELAATAFDSWRREWLVVAAASPALSCDPAAEREELSLAAEWLAFTGNGGAVCVAHADQAFDLMRTAISSGSTDAGADDKTIATDLVRAAWQDLVQRLMGTTADQSNAAPPPELWRRGSGAVCVQLPLARGEVSVVFDSALVSRLVPVRPRTAARLPALANPQLGLGRQPVEIRVWLGDTEIEFATLRTLAVNDVLLLDSRIDHPLRISVAGADAAPRAVLGYTGQNKAVRLTMHAYDR